MMILRYKDHEADFNLARILPPETKIKHLMVDKNDSPKETGLRVVGYVSRNTSDGILEVREVVEYEGGRLDSFLTKK